MSQSSHDSVDETLGEEHQDELRDTLAGLAPRTQDPDEDEAYTPTQLEERSWDTFEENPLRSMYGLAEDSTNSSSNNNSNNGFIHQEKFVRQVAQKYKYNPKRRTEQNLKLLTHLTTSPFAALTAKFPTWTDYKYSQHTNSNTAHTEAHYDSLNEFEDHFQSYILGCVETLLQSHHLRNFRSQKAGITNLIANFLRVAPQRINLPDLISQAFHEEDQILHLCIINKGSQPHAPEAEREREDILGAYGPWDEDIYQHGIPKSYRDFKDFCKDLWFFSDDRTENSTTEGKRFFDITQQHIDVKEENYSIPIIYALLCNHHVLNRLTKHLITYGKTQSMWISKPNPEGILAQVEKAEDSVYGFSYVRSTAFHKIYTAYLKHSEPKHQPKCFTFKRLRQVTPLGWDEDSLEAFPGNHMNSAEFSRWSRRMAFELLVFCRQERNIPDLKTLSCSTDLEKALNNHRIPNPFWACIAILKKNTDYPREQIVMRAREKFRSVKYDPGVWVDEYLASLLQRQKEAREYDDNIKDSALMSKFREQFILYWTSAINPNDPLDHLCVEYAKTWKNVRDKTPQPAADQKILRSLQNFTECRHFWNAKKQEMVDMGIKRKPGPATYWDSGYYPINKDNRVNPDLPRDLNVLDLDLLADDSTTIMDLLAMSQSQRKSQFNRKDTTQSGLGHPKAAAYFSQAWKNRHKVRVDPNNREDSFKTSLRAIKSRKFRPNSQVDNKLVRGTPQPSHGQLLKERELIRKILGDLVTLSDNKPIEKLFRQLNTIMNPDENEEHQALQQFKDLHVTETNEDDYPQEGDDVYQLIKEDANDSDEEVLLLTDYLDHKAAGITGATLHMYECLNLNTEAYCPPNMRGLDGLQTLIDSGASIDCRSSKLLDQGSILPGGIIELNEPIKINQGRGYLEINQAYEVVRYFKHATEPDTICIIISYALYVDFDREGLDIISTNGLQHRGLGAVHQPVNLEDPNSSPPTTYLRNYNDLVKIECATRKSGVPCAIDIGFKGFKNLMTSTRSSIKVIDGFTGKPYVYNKSRAAAQKYFMSLCNGAEARVHTLEEKEHLKIKDDSLIKETDALALEEFREDIKDWRSEAIKNASFDKDDAYLQEVEKSPDQAEEAKGEDPTSESRQGELFH